MTYVTEIRPIRKINKREARMAIRDHINEKKYQWKGASRATHKMGKGLHRVFSTIVLEISLELTNFGESGSVVSHFIQEPRNFAEVTRLTENIIKPWLKATLLRRSRISSITKHS